MAKKIILSKEQDKAANPMQNVWVQANAGTGKTSVLVQRLLRILFRAKDGDAPGILCLTYTNAGAGVMRNRILKQLRDWALSSDAELADLLSGVPLNQVPTSEDVLHARSLFFQYIDNPEMLKIKTIHGFCEEILHRFPLEAGLAPGWTLVSDTAQSVLMQETFERLINSPSENQRVDAAFGHIVTRMSETKMSRLIDNLSDQYKTFFMVGDIDKYRKYFVDTTWKFLELDNVPQMEISDTELKFVLESAQMEQNRRKSPAKYLENVINLSKQYIEKTIDFSEYADAYIKDDGGMRAYMDKIPVVCAEQLRVYNVVQYQANRNLYDDSVALFDLSAAFYAEYNRQKRSRNLLDFEDMILYTRKLFSSSDTMGWVLSQLDMSLSHILVDEAQDTSPMQWDILRMLAGDFFTDGDKAGSNRSLFVVGDTKQSIYGFQGADPRAFAYSREAIAAQIENNQRTIQDVPLAQSFRSTAPILNSVDRFFSDDEVIAVSGFVNNQHKCFRDDDAGVVELHKLIAKDKDGPNDTDYVSTVCDKISDLIQDGKYSADDIMILVQKRKPFAPLFTSELKRRGISVAGSDRIVLPDYPPVRDLLNLVRFCLKPSDDYSLCCVLKSPCFYLTEAQIFNLCKKKNDANNAKRLTQERFVPTTVFEVLADDFPEIRKTLADVLLSAAHMAPHSFFYMILYSMGVRDRFIAALGAQVIEPLEEFMTICLSYERTQPGTLYHFLKWFISGASEVKRDMEGAKGVRIVTVHGSKGLEAPVVFLVDTNRTPESDPTISLTSDDMPVWLWAARSEPSQKKKDAAQPQTEIKMAEYFRLLYVAMTRAKDELYIYAYTSRKNPTKNAWYEHLWRVFAGDNNEQEFIRITNDDIK